MKLMNMINMIKKFTDQYGVLVTWTEFETTINSRGQTVQSNTEIVKSSKVLLLKEKYNPLNIINSNIIGLSQEYARYLLVLPEIEIKKDMVITDNHNIKWKLGFIDWFDVGGVPVAKQTTLTEVK